MKKLLLALTALALATPAGATPQWPGYSNAGQCAGEVGSGCHYTLEIVNPAEPMVVIPGLEEFGPSRLSTVEWCVEVEGTNHWTELQTDSDFDLIEGCLIEHT